MDLVLLTINLRVKKLKNQQGNWTTCRECQGRGKRSMRLRKKVRLRYQRELDQFEKMNSEGTAPVRPKGHLYDCLNCGGSGLTNSTDLPIVDAENYPHVAIIGGGIGGVALAIACMHLSLIHI